MGFDKLNMTKLWCDECRDVLQMFVQNLTILQERCSDRALSVRKQALQSLTDLLDSFPLNKAIQKCVIKLRLISSWPLECQPSSQTV